MSSLQLMERQFKEYKTIAATLMKEKENVKTYYKKYVESRKEVVRLNTELIESVMKPWGRDSAISLYSLRYGSDELKKSS